MSADKRAVAIYNNKSDEESSDDGIEIEPREE
jgi:hypothetical protein